MFPLTTVARWLAWPVALAGILIALALTSNATLALISDGVHSTVVSLGHNGDRAKRLTLSLPRAAENRSLLSSAGRFASPDPVALEAPKPMSVVAMRALVLRSKPMPASSEVATIAKGDSLVVKSKQGRWWQVRTSDQKEGWLLGIYLAVEKA